MSCFSWSMASFSKLGTVFVFFQYYLYVSRHNLAFFFRGLTLSQCLASKPHVDHFSLTKCSSSHLIKVLWWQEAANREVFLISLGLRLFRIFRKCGWQQYSWLSVTKGEGWGLESSQLCSLYRLLIRNQSGEARFRKCSTAANSGCWLLISG